MRYEEILKKMKDYDENLSKEKIAKAYQEKEKRRLEVSFKIIYLYYFLAERRLKLADDAQGVKGEHQPS